MDEVVKAVNGLASASLNSKPELRHDRSPDPSLGTTALQEAMLRDMQFRLWDFVDSKCDFDETEALSMLLDLLGSTHLYNQEASHLANFDISKMIFSRKLRPMDESTLCPPHVSELLKFHKQFIEKSQAEILYEADSQEKITPYWDPRLKQNRKARIELNSGTISVGLALFQVTSKVDIIAFFAVKKKDGMQRLILDCRVTNSHHRRPPTTRLSTASCFAGLDLNVGLVLSWVTQWETRGT